MKAPRPLFLPASIFLPLLGMSALLHGQTHLPQSPVPQGLFTAIVAGDLDGDLSPEVAVIQGTSLIVFQNPDTSPDSIVVATNALDVCYWPTAGGPEAPGLLYTTPTGLALATFVNDGLSAYYHCQAIPYALQGATRIRFADDQGQEKLFFVGSDSKSFFSAAIVAGAITGAVPLFTLVPTVLDFVLLDYAGNADLDIGILHSNGVNIRSQANAVYLARSAIHPGDAIAAVRHPSSANMRDSLAWITRLSDDLPHLLLFNPLFNTPQNPYPYLGILLSSDPSVLYASATSADVDGNGTEDIVMGRTTSQIDVQKLGNPSNQPVFSGALVPLDISFPIGSPTPMGRIVCASFFNETNPSDVPLPGFAAMLTALNGLRLEHALPPPPPTPPQIPPPLLPDFEAVTYESAMHQTVPEHCETVAPVSAPRAEWRIDPGLGWGLTSANYLELIVRRCPGSTTAPEPNALAHWIFPIDTTTADIDSDGTGIQNTRISFHAGAGENGGVNWTTEDLASRYFAMVRPIYLESPPNFGSLRRAWRWSILGMSAQCQGAQWLAERPGAGTPIYIGADVCGDISCSSDNRLPPKAVPQSDIPASSPNVLPIIDDPSYND